MKYWDEFPELGDSEENRAEFLAGCNEIEKMFLTELLGFDGYDAMFNGALCFSTKAEESRIVHFEIVPQAVFPSKPKYRVDISLNVSFSNPPDGIEFIIEIDGHDFHEKTKQQIARDKKRERELLETGARIIRFSGSEVYRNPQKCWNDIFYLTYKILKRERRPKVVA